MERCAECGKTGEKNDIRRCTGCHVTRYCSRDCQKRHWPRHKKECKKHKDISLHNKETDNPSGTAASGSREATRVISPSPSGAVPLTACKKCGLQAREMKKCGHCQEVTYCSRDCQRADWREHKVTCQEMETITTEGFRQTVEREEAEQRATREREQTASRRAHQFLSSLLGNSPVTPRLTFEEARSRARRLFPGREIVDKFGELPNDLVGFMPSLHRHVAVVRINEVYYHWFRHGRNLKDAAGKKSFVLFHVRGDPSPYFRYEQLREGNFLCFHNAFLHFFLDGTVGFRVDNPADIHIMEP